MSRSLKALTDELLAAYTDLCCWLGRRLGNPHEAADVAQSSFERVYTHALEAPITAPRALLFRTAHHLCIDQARRRHSERRLLEARGVGQATTAPSAERVAAERQGGCQVICVTFSYLYSLPEQHHKLIEGGFPLGNGLGPLLGDVLQPHIQHCDD